MDQNEFHAKKACLIKETDCVSKVSACISLK